MRRKSIIIGMIAAIVVLGLFFAFLRPTAIGGDTRYLVVMSGSMEPSLRVGSVVVVREGEVNPLREGDIICFRRGSSLVTHRIYEVFDNGEFRTKGDVNEEPDGWVVRREDVVGKVMFVVPYLGYLGHLVRTPIGFVGLIIIPAALIIVNEARNILKQAKRVKRGRRRRAR